MIRSLRTRFFLLVWPLVVIAMVLLGLLLGRWSVVEIGRVSEELRLERISEGVPDLLIDSLAAIPAADGDAVAAFLDRVAARDSIHAGAVVVSAARGLIAASLPDLLTSEVTVGPGTRVTINQSRKDGTSRALVRMITNGRLIDPPGTPDPRMLVMAPIPTMSRISVPAAANPGTALIRRIMIALVTGSAVAALVTLLLSRQLAGRVERLAAGVRALGRGNLAARVPVDGGDEIAALARSFNTMASELERSEARRRQMVSDVAHELRTPLTNVIAMVESARDGLRSADPALLDALAEESALLNRLVDDLRDLALADAGELALNVDQVDVTAVARRAAAAFDHHPQGVTVRVEGPEGVTAAADEQRLGQVLRNLIGNAVTHSPPGGEVLVGVADGTPVRISVIDRGRGIPADEIGRIWERFWRADASRSRTTGGMGLGLPVARHLVELMGGRITAESLPGAGSTFTVELPRP